MDLLAKNLLVAGMLCLEINSLVVGLEATALAFGLHSNENKSEQTKPSDYELGLQRDENVYLWSSNNYQ